jgi:nitrogen fixation protein NifU and related proteins
MTHPYGDVIQEHFRHPRNYGALEAPDARHEEFNPLCGDRVRIELSLDEDGTVRAARFQGDLCMIAKASASLLTELVLGRTPAGIEEDEVLAALHADIPPARMQCVRLPLTALKAAASARA